MKKLIVICLFAASLAFASEPGAKGVGAEETATTTATQYTGFKAHKLSILNNGSVTVYVLVNATAAELDTAIAAGTAVPIPAGSSFTFDTQAKDTIFSFAVEPASGTADLVIGSF